MRLAENAAALDNRSVSGGGNLQFQWCATRGPTIEARAWAVFYRDDVWPIFHTRRRQGEFGHAPLLMAAAFGSIMIGYIASRVLLHYTRFDDATAFFVSVPGGVYSAGFNDNLRCARRRRVPTSRDRVQLGCTLRRRRGRRHLVVLNRIP